MNHVWKACIVAPEITPDQLQCVTSALKAAGWAEVRNVAEVRSLDDLYYADKGQLQQHAPGCERPTPELNETRAGCDCLYVGERIAGHSAFELRPVVRAKGARR